jgi:hypothetical protein
MPLLFAATEEKVDVVKFLVEVGAGVEAVDNDGQNRFTTSRRPGASMF